MNPLLTDLNDYIARLESEQSAIAIALHAAGVPEHVNFDDGKVKTLTLAERVKYALHRGPAFRDLFQASADLERLLNAIDAQPPGVEGALLWLQALRDCPPAPADLRGKIAQALNCHSVENASGTPDYVLADFLLGCLAAWDAGVKAREAWHGRPAPECVGPEPAPDGHVCPGCGAAEVEALDTARAVYACGSSNYHDQRPNSHLMSTQCLRDADAAARKDAGPELPTVGTYQVGGIRGVAEIKVCEDGRLRIRRNEDALFYDSARTLADVMAKHPNAVWTELSDPDQEE